MEWVYGIVAVGLMLVAAAVVFWSVRTRTVLFLDPDTGTLRRGPESAVKPGMARVQVQGVPEPVWVDAGKLKPGPVRHPPFDEGALGYVRRIRDAFAAHRPLSLEEWEEGFRRDADPAREVAIWLHAADVYDAFANRPDRTPESRADVYRVLVACMTASPDSVWQVVRLGALPRPEAEQIVNRFYGKSA